MACAGGREGAAGPAPSSASPGRPRVRLVVPALPVPKVPLLEAAVLDAFDARAPALSGAGAAAASFPRRPASELLGSTAGGKGPLSDAPEDVLRLPREGAAEALSILTVPSSAFPADFPSFSRVFSEVPLAGFPLSRASSALAGFPPPFCSLSPVARTCDGRRASRSFPRFAKSVIPVRGSSPFGG